MESNKTPEINVIDTKELTKFQKLEKRVNILLDLKEVIDNLGQEIEFNKTATQLNQFLSQVESNFPPTVLESYQRVAALQERLDILAGKSLTELDFERDDLLDFIEEEKKQIDQINEDLNKLLQDYDVDFLIRLNTLIKTLIKKNEYVCQISRGELSLQDELTKQKIYPPASDKPEFDLTAIIDIEKNPLEISLVLKKEYWQAVPLCKYSFGIYLPGTPFILIKEQDNEESINSSKEHERIHNLIDTAIPYNRPAKVLDDRITLYKRLIELKSPDIILENQKELILSLCEADNILDNLQNEFIAALTAKKYLFFKEKEQKNRDKIFKALGFLQEKKFNISTSTAGDEIREVSNILTEKNLANITDKQFRNYLINQGQEIRKRFHSIFHATIALLKAAEKIDEVNQIKDQKTYERVSILTYLLKPSQYLIGITRYLELKHSREKILNYITLGKVLTDGQLTFQTLNTLLKFSDILNEQDKNLLARYFCNFNISFIPKEIQSLENLRHYQKLVKQCGLALRINTEYLENQIEGYKAVFFLSFIETEIKNKQAVIDFYQKLPHSEQDIFREELYFFTQNSTIDSETKKIVQNIQEELK